MRGSAVELHRRAAYRFALFAFIVLPHGRTLDAVGSGRRWMVGQTARRRQVSYRQVRGRGRFTAEFSSQGEVPQHLTQRIIDDAKKEKATT